MYARRIIVLLAYFITVCLAVAIAKGYTSDKRVHNPVAFKTMMRYGRSSSSTSDKDPKPVNVYPRNDAFFLGPRYGKRSTWNPSASLGYPVTASLCAEGEDLSCIWIGLSNLYRCSVRKDVRMTSN